MAVLVLIADAGSSTILKNFILECTLECILECIEIYICRMIRTILDCLSWKCRREILRLQVQKTGKTPLHLAAITGQPCQIEALMYYGESF